MNPNDIPGVKRLNETMKRIEDICGGPAAPTARQSNSQQLIAISDALEEMRDGIAAHRVIEELLTAGHRPNFVGEPRATLEVDRDNMACLLKIVNASLERDLAAVRALVRSADEGDEAMRG